MNQLVVVAASGLAREAMGAVRRQAEYEIVGVLDDDPRQWGELVDGVKVLGGTDTLVDHPDVHVVICAGKGTARAAIATRLDLADQRYATVVDPSVDVPPSCDVGTGSIVLAGTVLTADVSVGRHVVVMPNVTLTHDDVVADFATLCAGVSLGGAVRIERGAYVGMAATIRENVTAGPGCTIGMGAVVLQDVPPGETWVGSPAHRLVRA